jgi:transposase-like protein
MIAIACPYCHDREKVIRFGTNRSGTERCRCKACGKTFTLVPKSRALTPEKEAAILGALAERISQRGIARALKVSRLTIREVRKRGLSG